MGSEVRVNQPFYENVVAHSWGVRYSHSKHELALFRNEGTEEVAGTETIHIAADVDVGKLFDDIDGLLKRAGDLGLTEQACAIMDYVRDMATPGTPAAEPVA